MTDILILIVLVEGIVFYIFHAAPLQRPRGWLIKKTPFLRVAGDHLFECKICLTTWVSFMAVLTFLVYGETIWFYWVAVAIVCARTANWIHLVFSLVQDHQLDLRIRRGSSRSTGKEKKGHAET